MTRDQYLMARLHALELRASGRRGRDVLWATGSRAGTQALQFLSTLVLARILTPHAFGVVAIALVFVGFASLFSDLGLGAALVRTPDLSRALLTTVFYWNLCLGIGAAVLIAGVSVPLASAYHLPALKLVLVIAGLNSALNLSIVPLAVLERAFRFRLIAVVEFTCGGIAAGISVTLAAIGVGAVSLVIGPVVAVIIESIVLWLVVRLPIAGLPTANATRELLRYSGPLVAFSTLNYWVRNVDNLVLGIIAGAAALGVYTRAYALMLIPVQQVTVVLSRVLLPTLSKHHGSHDNMRAVYVHALKLSSAITIPAGAGMACLCSPITLVLLGPKWHEVAPLLAVLAASTPISVIVATTGPIYQALGDTGAWSRRSGLTAVVTMVGLCVGAVWGPMGVAIGWTVLGFGTAFYLIEQPWRFIGLSFRAGVTSLIPQFISAVVMIICLIFLDAVARSWSPVLWLGSGVVAGSGIYFLALALLDTKLLCELWFAVMRRSDAEASH